MPIKSECQYKACPLEDSDDAQIKEDYNVLYKKLGSAVFYGLSSFLLTVAPFRTYSIFTVKFKI